jgi:peroxiredoxin
MTTELKVGDPAPDFKATAVGGIYGGGHEVKFSELAGSTLVLYFYPENDTPGCTIQACDLRDSWRELQSKVELFGVSTDSVQSHQEFIKKTRSSLSPVERLGSGDCESVSGLVRRAYGYREDHLSHRPRP